MPTQLIAPAKQKQPFPDLGKFCTYAQAIKSQTAILKGIDNTPTLAQYNNMQRVYDEFYEPLCRTFGALPITSFFRSERLNKAIGGAKDSAHKYGCAIDIDCDGLPHLTNRQLFDHIRKNYRVDKLILESPDKFGNPQWVHLGINPDGMNRNELWVMTRVNGKATYQRFIA